MNLGPEYTPLGEAAIKIGILSVVAGILLGIGNLTYYCLGLGPQPTALEQINSGRWSEEVKLNIQTTYFYLFVSIYVWILAAAFVFSNDGLFWAFTSLGMVIVDFIVQILVQSGKSFARLRNDSLLSPQRVAWFAYVSFVGGMTSTAFLFGAESVNFAFHLTYMTVIILVILSMVAPVGKYAAWHQSLNAFEGVVFISSLCSAIFPITTSLGAIFFSISYFGGLILFVMYFLCHSQEAQISATEPPDGNAPIPYSAISKSVPMLLDTISIFTRIVALVPPPP